MAPVLPMEALEALGKDGVKHLIRLRPDLGHPPATSMQELARRAVSAASLSVALRAFDLPTLQVAEALAALGPRSDRRALEELLGIPPGEAHRSARQSLDRVLETLRRRLFLQAHREPR